MNLYPFQVEGVKYLLSHPRVLLGDEMGLGKTVQVISAMNAVGVGRVLIVCPASLADNWATEISQWGYDWLWDVQVIRKGTDKVATGPSSVCIVSYGLVSKIGADKLKWDALICDEAHNLQNPRSIRTMAVAHVRSRIKWFLTGTPVKNRPINLHSLLSILQPGEWGHRHEYGLRYCDKKRVFRRTRQGGKMVWDDSGSSNLEELNERLYSSLLLRREKSQVLDFLPSKTRQFISIPAPQAVAEEKSQLSKPEACIATIRHETAIK